MKKIRAERVATRDGYCRWIRPVMRGYLLECCDCGLVHEVQFRAISVVKRYADGRTDAKLLPSRKVRVEFRVRRRNGYTAASRKRRK